MDPQQGLLLELGYSALHGSSHRRSTLMGGGSGVFLGMERPDWAFAQPPAARSSVYAVTGDNLSVAAGRVVGRVELVYTADMKLNHFGIRAIRFFPKILAGSKHFPESARRIVSIGNNKVAVTLYQRVIRPFVPAHTKEKLIILGRDLRSARVVARRVRARRRSIVSATCVCRRHGVPLLSASEGLSLTEWRGGGVDTSASERCAITGPQKCLLRHG